MLVGAQEGERSQRNVVTERLLQETFLTFLVADERPFRLMSGWSFCLYLLT